MKKLKNIASFVLMSFRRVLKNNYVFIATKDQAARTVRVKADTFEEAEIKAQMKYPDWEITPHRKHYNSPNLIK